MVTTHPFRQFHSHPNSTRKVTHSSASHRTTWSPGQVGQAIIWWQITDALINICVFLDHFSPYLPLLDQRVCLVGCLWVTGADEDMLSKAPNCSSCPRAPRILPWGPKSNTWAEPADGLRSHFHCVSVVLLLSPRPIPLIHYWTLHVAHWFLVIAQFWTWQSSFNTMTNNTMHKKQDFTHSKFVSLHWTMKHCSLNTRYCQVKSCKSRSRQHILQNCTWQCILKLQSAL